MHNITLICTRHKEDGKCNQLELYKILESINPDVIFDELTREYFQMFFSETFDIKYTNSILLNTPLPIPLEIKCLKKYNQNTKIKIFPIDIDVSQELSKHQKDIFTMFSIFLKNENYKKLDIENETSIKLEGFSYLNSNKFLDYLEKKEILIKNIINSEKEKDKLLNIYNLFKSLHHENRENKMINNIYSISKEKHYDKAVFLIGAEHKKSIVKKIFDHEKKSEIKLNWTIYNSE